MLQIFIYQLWESRLRCICEMGGLCSPSIAAPDGIWYTQWHFFIVDCWSYRVSSAFLCLWQGHNYILSFYQKNIWLFTLSSSSVSIYALHQGRCGKNIPSCWCFTNIPKKFFQIISHVGIPYLQSPTFLCQSFDLGGVTKVTNTK